METNNKNEKISNLIASEFDTRMEASIFSYILENGMENLTQITEDEVNDIEGNGFMTARFCQALVRTAVKICKEYTPMDIMEYIRVGCYFTPFPKTVTFYKEDYSEIGWEELCGQLDRDGEEESAIEVLIINQEG